MRSAKLEGKKQSELRTFECMSAFEVIQECEHLNASGIVCIESVYEFKEPGMEFLETHRIFQRKLHSVNFTFVGNFL